MLAPRARRDKSRLAAQDPLTLCSIPRQACRSCGSPYSTLQGTLREWRWVFAWVSSRRPLRRCQHLSGCLSCVCAPPPCRLSPAVACACAGLAAHLWLTGETLLGWGGMAYRWRSPYWDQLRQVKPPLWHNKFVAAAGRVRCSPPPLRPSRARDPCCRRTNGWPTSRPPSEALGATLIGHLLVYLGNGNALTC